MIYIIFLISIILHELTHVFVGLFLGYKMKNFCFLPFGAYIEFEDNNDSKYQNIKKIIIYLSGPCMNFIISYFFYILKNDISEQVIYTNLILGVFNLLPINPLDGGKILKEVLKIFFNNQKSNIYSYKITKLLLCFFTFFYGIFIIEIKNITLLFVLVYIWYINIKEYEKLSKILKMYSIIEKNNV